MKWVYHIVILFYFQLGSSLLGSTFVFTRHFGAKTILSRSHFEDDSSPYIYGFGSLIRIELAFVQFKQVILMWINYLETWLRSDNTSCYYKLFKLIFCQKISEFTLADNDFAKLILDIYFILASVLLEVVLLHQAKLSDPYCKPTGQQS